MKDSSQLAQDRRAWGASIRDVVKSIGGTGSTRVGLTPLPIQARIGIIL